MPLSGFVAAELARVRTFLSSPDAIALELRAMAEHEPMVAKLLVSFAERAEDLFVAVDGPFTGAAGLCAQIQEALGEALAQARAVFDEDGIALQVPPEPALAAGFHDMAPEAQVVSWGERIAREVYPVFEHVVVVIKPTVPGDPGPLAACLSRLCLAAESGRLKFIVICERPLGLPAAVPRPRLEAFAPGPEEQRRAALARFLRTILARVLVVPGERHELAWLGPELQALTARTRTVAVQVDAVRFWRPVHFYGRAAEGVVAACHRVAEARGEGARTAPFVKRVQHPCGAPEAEAYFVGLLEELAAAWLPPDGTLVVLLSVDLESPDVLPGEAVELAASLRRLARAAVWPGLKLLVAGRGLAAAPVDAAQVATVHEVRLDGPVIEAGIKKRLEAPDVPTVERLRLTTALASFAIVRGEPEQALALSVQTIALAQQTGSPDEQALAQYATAGVLYRCAALGPAMDAYTQALELAIERNNGVMAAQALTGIGNCQIVGGKHEEAVCSYDVARTYFAKAAHPVGESYALTWSAEACARARRRDEAERRFREALACCDRGGEGGRHGRAEILQRLGAFYQATGRGEEARRCLDEARAAGPTAPLADEP